MCKQINSDSFKNKIIFKLLTYKSCMTIYAHKSVLVHIKMLSTNCAFIDHIIHGAFNTFPDFFVQAFKIVVDS